VPIGSPVHRLGLQDFHGQLWLVFSLCSGNDKDGKRTTTRVGVFCMSSYL